MKRLKEIFKKHEPDITPVMEFPTHAVSMNGQFFFINQHFYEQVAPSLSKKISVKYVVNEADLWVRSTTTVSSAALWILLVSTSNIYLLVVAFMFIMVFWHTQKAALYVPSLSEKLHRLTNDLIWFLGSSVVLTLLGNAKNYTNLGIGLVLLFLLRSSLLQRFFNLLYTKMYKTTLNDRLIQFVILKQSIYRGIPVASLASMVDAWKKRFNK